MSPQAAPGQAAPLGVIMLTYQEEANIRGGLENVCGWADQVFVVDSFSTDRTLAIAQEFGVPVFQNPFENMAQQRNWALAHLPLVHSWVLFLDADERVTPELQTEIAPLLRTLPEEVAGLYTRRRFIWMGRWLKHGGMHKWVLRIVRRDRAWVEMTGRREYMRVRGQTLHLQHDLIHEDGKGMGDWIRKHHKYASQEAAELLACASGSTVAAAGPAPVAGGAYESEGDRQVKLRRLWNRLPLFFRPPLNFLIKYILMLGFLDGIPGAVYYSLHDFWYPLLVDVKLLELRQAASKGKSDGAQEVEAKQKGGAGVPW